MQKTYNVSIRELTFLNFFNKKFLIHAFTIYLSLPVFTQLVSTPSGLTLLCTDAGYLKQFKVFSTFLLKWLKRLHRLYTKRLLLKGLGLKIIHHRGDSAIELKLGFSHSIRIILPSKLQTVVCYKNFITATSFSSTFLNNFMFCVKQHKQPDSYKGKGFWYKNEVKKLKLIKKK